MLVSLNRNNILFIVIFSIHIGIILADDNKCSIEHCQKCSDENKCEICKEGYTLNFGQTKCLELIKNNNKQSSSAQKSSPNTKKSSASTSSGSAKKSSLGSAKKSSTSLSPSNKKSSSTPSGSEKKKSSAKKSSSSTQKSSNSSSSKKSSQANPSGPTKKSSVASLGKNSNTSVKKALNAPIASNNAFQSAFEGKLEEEKSYTSIICKVAIFCVAGIIIFFCIKLLKNKKNKVGYFYDESGNPEEKAKVVYIQ